MGNGESAVGTATEKIRLISNGKLTPLFSVLSQIAFVVAAAYAAWCVLSYRVERLEKDQEHIQRTVRDDLPRIREELVEIKAELRWMGRQLGVPAKE